MQKEIEIVYGEGEGLDRIEFKGKLTIKRLNFSEKNSLEEEATDIKFAGETPIVKVSPAKMKELALLKGISSAELIKTTYVEDKVSKKPIPINNPYVINILGIKELPQSLGEMLFAEWTALNSLNVKKKEN